MAPASLRSLISSPSHANTPRFFPGSRRPCWRLPSLRSLISSPGHANMPRVFPGSRRSCWRRPSCEALFLRRVTPTQPELSRAVAAPVGAFLPAKPYFFAGSRQHAPSFPGRSPTMLAPSALRSLISSPGHANRRAGGRAGRPVGVASPNTARIFPASHFFYSAST